MGFSRDKFKDIYPFRENYLDRPGIRMHYLDEGSGEPLIMVHGNPTWSFFYRELVKHFSKTHRVIVPDHIGCGLSEKPDDNRYSYCLKNRVDDLEALVNHLVPDGPVTMVVHDWGGAIGMGYATRNPARIKRLVIFNTAAFSLPFEKPFPWPLWIFRNTGFGEYINRAHNAFARITAATCTVSKLPKIVKEGFVAPYDSWENRIAIARFVQDIPLTVSDPSWDQLMQIQKGLRHFEHTPALVCWGRKDFIFDLAFFKEWGQILRNAQFHSFSEAGHYLLEDVPDRIKELMTGFFAETDRNACGLFTSEERPIPVFATDESPEASIAGQV